MTKKTNQSTKKAQTKSASGDITTSLKETQKNQALVTITVAADKAEAARQEALAHMGEGVTIKGFRKGKAPINLVEKQLDPQKVLEHAVNHLLPEMLTVALKENDFKPLANPQIHLVEANKGSEWKFEMDMPLQPDFDIKGYKEYIKGELATSAIWTPGKGDDKEEPSERAKQEARLKKLIDALLAKYKFEVPPMLVESEINRSLARLLDQVERLGLQLEDYLKQVGKSGDELRAEYHTAAQDNLRMEIILARLAHEMNIEVSDEEIMAMINTSGDEKTQAQLSTPEQKQYIRGILEKRKTIDALLSL
jgi:FKBP-type peptidyl-prolyl cis-trans isomerase (trigger factor)